MHPRAEEEKENLQRNKGVGRMGEWQERNREVERQRCRPPLPGQECMSAASRRARQSFAGRSLLCRTDAKQQWAKDGWGAGVLRATVSSPVCVGDSGTQWPAHQCFSIIDISWKLCQYLRVMESRVVLWKLEVWIPNPLSGIRALNRSIVN